MFDLLDLHTRLVSAARPSGSEHTGIAQVLRELAAPLVDSVETDDFSQTKVAYVKLAVRLDDLTDVMVITDYEITEEE